MQRVLPALVLAAGLALPVLAQADPGMPATGDATSHRMTAALNDLEAQGYGAFSNFHPAGAGYAATVDQDGRQFTVMVNPDSGQVTPQS
jgi:hypothetical protein